MNVLVALIGAILVAPMAFAKPIVDCGKVLEGKLSSSGIVALNLKDHVELHGVIPNLNDFLKPLTQNEAEFELHGVGTRLGKSFGFPLNSEWEKIEGVTFHGRSIFGYPGFEEKLRLARFKGQALSSYQSALLRSLNESIEEALDGIKKQLIIEEEDLFLAEGRLHSEPELDVILKRLTQNQEFRLKFLPFTNTDRTAIENWHRKLFRSSDKMKRKIREQLDASLFRVIMQEQRIPEKEETVLQKVANDIGIPRADVESYFGEGKVYSSYDEYLEWTLRARKSELRGIPDMRFFSEDYENKMREAVRNSQNWIVNKLVESQSTADLEILWQASVAHNAPILLFPAFSDVGAVVGLTENEFFKRPNVFIVRHQMIQLDKNTYVVNNGAIDKILNPTTGNPFDPTDRVFLVSPSVINITTASGEYGFITGLTMTSGSMSLPEYRSIYAASAQQDFKAQRRAEDNRGFLLISRQYDHPDVTPVIGGANGVMGRRASVTWSREGIAVFDMGKLITAEGVKNLDYIPAKVVGDFHKTATDPMVERADRMTDIQLGILKKNPLFNRRGAGPQLEYVEGPVKLGALVYPDFQDGTPLNGYIFDQLMSLNKADQSGLLSLKRMAQDDAAFLNREARLRPHTAIIVQMGNHEVKRLIRVLQKGDFRNWHSPEDLDVLIRLMYESMTQGGNPYERLLEYYGVSRGVKNIVFMNKHDSARMGVDLENLDPVSLINGTEVGPHTDEGKNGARGISLKTCNDAYKAIVGAHDHKTGEFYQAKRVGAFTPIVQGYHTGGPGSSDASVALVYSKTAVQILRSENGRFLPNPEANQAPEDFYPSDYFPIFVEAPKIPPGGQMQDALNSRARQHKYRAGVGERPW